ncbi:MAG: UvrD-helicase domain-containing protein [Ilumatobacteraceae bacterium]
MNRRALLEQAVSATADGRRVGFPSRSSAPNLDWLRARNLSIDAYPDAARAARRSPRVGAALVVETASHYHTLKRRRGVVDFDDLLEGVREELERDPDFAAQLHWRFRHFFVDEFQDVNPLQHALLEGWRGGRNDLCLVGDPRQAIYGWNGAEPTLLDQSIRPTRGFGSFASSTTTGVLHRWWRQPRPCWADRAATTPSPVRPPLGGIQIEATTDEAGRGRHDRRVAPVPPSPRGALALDGGVGSHQPTLEALDAALAQQGIPVASARAADTDDDAEVARLLGTARRLPSAEQLVAWGRDLDEVADDAPSTPPPVRGGLARRRVAAGVQRFVGSCLAARAAEFAEWFEVSGGGVTRSPRPARSRC